MFSAFPPLGGNHDLEVQSSVVLTKQVRPHSIQEASVWIKAERCPLPSSRLHTWARHRGLSFGTTLLIQPHPTPHPPFRPGSPPPCPPNNARSRLRILATAAFSSLQMTFPAFSVQTMMPALQAHLTSQRAGRPSSPLHSSSPCTCSGAYGLHWWPLTLSLSRSCPIINPSSSSWGAGSLLCISS